MTFPLRKPLQRRHIEAIAAIGDLHSVHKAAQRLGVPQPALSRILAETEHMLGAQLFERSSHGSRPTARGEAVLAHARLALRSLERLDEALTATRPAIRLGCIPRAMHTLIPRLLEYVYPAPAVGTAPVEPDFEFSVTEGSSISLLDQMKQGSLDFAILRSDPAAGNTHGNVVFEQLYGDRIVVICSDANQALRQSTLPLGQLADHGWLLPETSTSSRIAFDRFWTEQGLLPIQPLIEVRSFETNLALVAGTRFLSIAPESIVRPYEGFGGVKVLKVRPALPSSPVMLASGPASEDNPLLARFRKMLHEAAKSSRVKIT